MLYDLAGLWDVQLADGSVYQAALPGTLDENAIGGPDTPNLATRLTRKYTYEGEARFTRPLPQPLPTDCVRRFLEVERARGLRLLVDNQEITPYEPGTLSTPWRFELPGNLTEASVLTLISDNTYAGLPRKPILMSSAATDETQTNWNGLLGYIRLRCEKSVFLSQVRVYPTGSRLFVEADFDAAAAQTGTVLIESEALTEPFSSSVSLEEGRGTLRFGPLPIKTDAKRWDEYEGSLYTLTVKARLQEDSLCETVSFGIRDFSRNDQGRLTINGRVFFLRGEANCCEFPESGHPPMSVDAWMDVLSRYRAYGINCMRFHSHCPPEAAFTAADRLGMLMQPELSHWNPRNAFEDPDSRRYYRQEALSIVKNYANHPSFVMLSFGNELVAHEEGHAYMTELLKELRALDPTRMYANGSNVHYGQAGVDPNSDFYASQKYYALDLRGAFAGMEGYINGEYPSAAHNYSASMAELRKTSDRPVFSFEVGQFEVLPDFDEIADFKGVTRPVNLEIIRDRVRERGLMPQWKGMVEASGELSFLGYREEIEAVLRTPEMSGISLLGLQDFTGQGTALVGMMNSHLDAKPYPFADPSRFAAVFNDVVPLALLPRYTATVGECLRIPTRLANYGKRPIEGSLSYSLGGLQGSLPPVRCPMGALSDTGLLELTLTECGRFTLSISIGGYSNTYPLWIYPDEDLRTEGITVAVTWEEAEAALKNGEKVFYTPPATEEGFPHSVHNQFTTDFWSVGTFPQQEGCMGLKIDAAHPAFTHFPTETHSNFQWWVMSGGRAVHVPDGFPSIVTVLDSYAKLRSLSCLFECRVGTGRLLVSSMGLLENLRYPEVRALANSLLDYMRSKSFAPSHVLPLTELAAILR